MDPKRKFGPTRMALAEELERFIVDQPLSKVVILKGVYSNAMIHKVLHVLGYRTAMKRFKATAEDGTVSIKPFKIYKL